jgi:iron-sulfur cluster assembly accessory protein
MSETAVAEPVALSERAAAQVKKVLSKEAPGSFLRLAVNGGGCSGFQYAFDVVSTRDPDDLVVERDGATVLIDPVSVNYLLGSKIDFVDDLMGQSFRVDNPQATASCGCGTSFAL